VFLKHVILGLLFLAPLGCLASDNAMPPGFVEGHVKIISPKEVELADENPPNKATAQNYLEYPLIVLSQDGKKEFVRITADENGNYRVALPPGAYLLDVQDRARKHVRAKPQLFTVVSNQTVHVDMDMDTGIR
jgi:hypothetical protein